MSLLEDVFLEDEANEAQELERVIEGDEFDERPRSRSDSHSNSEREDEAEEEKKRVDPVSTKARRVIKNPRFILNPARLTGPRGIQVIPEHFKDFKFKGKGHEKEDLDLVLKKLEHWAYRLYPKFKFEDCLKKIETLGKKRPVMVHLHKIRTDQYLSEETVVQRDSSDNEAPNEAPSEAPPEDEFDKLLQQQIELARATPMPASAKKGASVVKENRSLIMPKATSSPSISEEQRERILKSRKIAEERRLARLKNASNAISTSQNPENIANASKTPSKSDYNTYTQNEMSDNENNTTKNASAKNNPTQNIDNIANTASTTDNITYTHEKALSDDEIDKINSVNTENHVGKVRKPGTNVIDSSDEEDDVIFMNEPIKADIHKLDRGKRFTNGIKEGPKQIDDKMLEMGGNSSNDQENESSSDEDDIVLMNESVRGDVHRVYGYKNHTNDVKEVPKQIDKIVDDVLENDGNSIIDHDNDNSSDEGDVVLMNESIRVDVHKADNDKEHTYGIKHGPKLTAGHTINSDVILEIVGNSDDNDSLDIEKCKKLIDVSEKKPTTKVGGINNIETGNKKIQIDNNEAFDNLDHNNANIDEENDLAMIISESNTNDHDTSNTDVDMANNEKSANVRNSQEIKHNAEVDENQEAIFNEEVSVEQVSVFAVENNLDDLMDVEFDDDF